jgi:hypothetical protein
MELKILGNECYGLQMWQNGLDGGYVMELASDFGKMCGLVIQAWPSNIEKFIAL